MTPSLPYRKSAGADRCRWPEPDADGRCRYCGWALTRVKAYMAPDGIVTGHYRHRRPHVRKLPGEYPASNPHEGGTSLTLWEVISPGPIGPDDLPRTNRTQERQPTYPHQPDSNRPFRQYAGAGARLAVPTAQEWAAWKARWA